MVLSGKCLLPSPSLCYPLACLWLGCVRASCERVAEYRLVKRGHLRLPQPSRPAWLVRWHKESGLGNNSFPWQAGFGSFKPKACTTKHMFIFPN